MRGGRSASGGLSLTGGNIVALPGSPGVLFGTVQPPNTPERLTYVIFFKFAPRAGHEAVSRVNFTVSTEDRNGKTEDAMVVFGRRVEATYRIELDKTRREVSIETLEVGGRRVDMGDGRVFLVDLTAANSVYRQREAHLPSLVSELKTTEDVERFVEEIRKGLEGQDPEIRAFLR